MDNYPQNKLDRIFDATLRLTGKVGIAGLTMSGIAKEAGIATGTLYIYFENKEKLLNALYLELHKEGAVAIIKEINHLSPQVQLYKMWNAALRSLVENHLRMVFSEQFTISPYISEDNKKKDSAFKAYLKDLMTHGKEQNQIRDMDNDILICLIMGFIRNFSFHLVHQKEGKLTEELVDHSFSLCWDAIKK